MITARKEEKKMLPIYKYSVSDITKDEVKTITEKKRKPINIHTLSCTFQGKKNTTCVVGDEQLDEVKKNGYFEQKRQFGLGEFANYILQFSTYVKETGRIYFMPEYTNEIVEAIHSLFLFAGDSSLEHIPLLLNYEDGYLELALSDIPFTEHGFTMEEIYRQLDLKTQEKEEVCADR